MTRRDSDQPGLIVRASPLAVVVGVGVLLAFVMCFAVPAPGTFDDDGVYLATSRSLAETGEYRHPGLPGRPWQTKYPPMWPLTLSIVWRCGASPEGVATTAAVINALCWLGAAVCAYALAVRWWRLPRWAAASSSCLALLNPYMLRINHGAMSEAPFALLFMQALLLARSCIPRLQAPAIPQTPILPVLGLAAAVSAAILTRSIAIAPCAAVAVHLVFRRAWLAGAACLLAGAITFGAWSWWTHHAGSLNTAIPATSHLRYDLDYGAWAGPALASLPRVAWFNLADLGVSLLAALGPAPSWVTSLGEAGNPVYTGALGVLALVVMAIIALGLWQGPHSGAARVECFAVVAYLGLVLAWPFPVLRFLLPLLPLLYPALLAGVMEVVRSLHRAVVSASPGPVAGPPLAAALIVAAGVAWLGVPHTIAYAAAGGRGAERDARSARAAMIRDHTPTDAVVATVNPAWFALASGRVCVPLQRDADPVALLYPPDRSWLVPPDRDTPGRIAAMTIAQGALPEQYDALGVTHVCVPRDVSAQGEPHASVRRRLPERFLPVAECPDAVLYRYVR